MSIVLDFDLVADQALTFRVGTATFSHLRNSIATRLKSDGYLEELAVDAPIWDHHPDTLAPVGVRSEDASENLCLYSSDLSNAAWVATLTKDTTSVTDIMGAANTNVRLTATGANQTCLQSITSVSADRAYSVYMKRVTGTGNIEITCDGGSTWTAQTLTADWKRFEIKQAAVTDPQVGVRIVTSGDEIDFCGSQLENYAFATSYIPTVAASVPRAATYFWFRDMVGWNNTNGCVYYQFHTTPNGKVGEALGVYLSLQETNGILYYNNRVQDWYSSCVGPGVSSPSGFAATNDVSRFAASYAADDFRASVNGSILISDTNTGGVTITNATYASFGSRMSADETALANRWRNIWVQAMRVYDTPFDNATLNLMSTGTFPSAGGGAGKTGPGLTFGMMGKMGAA